MLLVAAFANVIFAGKSLVLSDNHNPMDARFTAENHGKDFVPSWVWSQHGFVTIPNNHDPGATWWQWEPAGELFRKAIRKGEIPFWDPYVGAGAPSMANLTPAYLFPPYLAMVLLGNTALLKNAYFLGVLLVAGVFTYLFLRRHQLSNAAALFGAGAFMFCGDLIQTTGSFIGQTAACLPFVLFLTRWFLDRPTWSRSALLALGFASVALASFPPILLAVFSFVALYAAAMLWMWPENAGEGSRQVAFLRFGAAACLGLGLVFFYYLPAFSVLANVPHVREFYRDEGLIFLPLASVYQLLGPVLMGGEAIYARPPMPDPGRFHLHYVGALPLTLALFAGRRPIRRGPLFEVCLAMGVLVLLKIWGVPPVQWIALLPGLNTVHFAVYFGVVAVFAVSVLAAIGLDNMEAGRVSGRRVGLVLVVALVFFGTLWRLGMAHGVPERLWGAAWIRHWIFAALLAAVTLAAAVASASSRLGWLRRAVGPVLITLLGVQAWVYTFYPRQYRWDVWRNPVPYVRRLMEAPGNQRILNLAGLNANVNSAFRLFSLDSLYTFNPPRAFELYRRYVGPRNRLFLREASRFPPDIVLDRAAIGLVAIRTTRPFMVREAESRGYERVYADDATLLYRREAVPRYFFSSRYRVADRERALEEVGRAGDKRELILEAAPSFSSAPNTSADPPVELIRFGLNRVALRVRAPRPGMVYAAEADFPGWSARVNGRPVVIRPANYAFRAVEVPAGDATVELKYFPPGLLPGLGVSLASAAVLGALLLRDRVKERRA